MNLVCKISDRGVTHLLMASHTLMVDPGATVMLAGARPGGRTYDRPVPPPSSDLLELLRARDPTALRDIVDRHARRLYRAARGMGFSASDAEDLAHEVFVTFLETIDRFEGRAEVSTWLFGILYRKAQERRRSHAREELSDSVEAQFDARFDAKGSWITPPTSADQIGRAHV